ncbi:MAG: caspase domain-containing protein [Rhizobiaceae bacterium]|nr:caspase domain-containing protein [Rhizobiaceae bacterium]
MMKNAQKFSSIARKFAALLIFALSFAFVSSAAIAAKRVALVLGNSDYDNAPTLANPRNDAEDMTEKLTSLGFEVVGGFDLNNDQMRDKIREFSIKLRDADVGLFFYAGHALQVNGRNYLAPVDTNIQYESDLDFETIPMDFIQRQMERETKTALLFLDACRNNPLLDNVKGKTRAFQSTRGLARDDNTSEGTFIAFATQPDNVALDGTGRNSPFTRALLDNLSRPGIEISTLMTDVRRQVFQATEEKQIPWTNSSLLGRFYFNEDQSNEENNQVASLVGDTQTPRPSVVTTAPTVTKSSNTVETDRLLSMRLEQMAWEAVKDSTDKDELSAYIRSYGTGFFGDLAKLRLKRIANDKETQIALLKESQSSRKIVVEKAVRDTPEKSDEVAEKPSGDQVASLESDIVPAGETEVEAPRVVTRSTIREIQSELNRIGCVAGSADGLWGKKSIRALNQYSKHAKVRLASIQPTHELLKELKKYNSRICPKVAPKRIIKQQVKTCKPGQKTSRKGNCYWPKTQQVKTCKPGQKLSRKGNCYWPRAQQVITCQPGQRKTRNGSCFWPQQQQQVRTCQPGQRLSSNGICYWPQAQPQPQPQPLPPRQGSGLLGGAIGGVIINCGILKNC